MVARQWMWLAGVAALTLAGCDNGPSAVASKQAAGTQMAISETARQSFASVGDEADGAQYVARGVDHRRDPVPTVDGAPMWSASRRNSAEENARKAFARNGEDFGADNLDAFVRKAHDFVGHPPRGALTLTRANGDVLIYDPRANVFAVRAKSGAPRTMFKPDEGMAYWEEQKAREAKRLEGRRTARKGRDDDEA